MKKQLLILLAGLSLLSTAVAQDTIRTRSLGEGYFYNNWPFDTMSKPMYPIYGYNYVPGYSRSFFAKDFSTDDTLNIVGIAVALSPIDPIHVSYSVLDLSYDNAYEYFMLMEKSADTLRTFSDSLLIHQRHSPIAYYMDFDFYYDEEFMCYGYQKMPVYEVYESYFSHPYQVNPGPFYVGVTTRSCTTDTTDAATGIYYDYKALRLAIAEAHVGNPNSPYMTDYLTLPTFCEEWWDSSDSSDIDPATGWWGHLTRDTTIWSTVPAGGYMFLFPILAPDDTSITGDIIVRPGNTIVITPGDTIIVSGDTLVNFGDTLVIVPGDSVVIGGDTLVINLGDTLTGDIVINPDGTIVVTAGGTIKIVPVESGGTPGVGLRPNDPIYRYTSVAPNPARNSVRVTSSFGLSRIEAYDAHGRLIKECNIQHSALSIDLDVSSWLRGTYLLRISTPIGVTTKKLLIRQ